MMVLVYDGECHMCSRLIQFVVKANKNKALKITDFNSNWSKNNIEDNQQIDSIIMIDGNQSYYYSSAIIHLFTQLRPSFKWLFIFKLIPTFVRDGVYTFIAKRRKRLNRSIKACPLPSEDFLSMYLT